MSFHDLCRKRPLTAYILTLLLIGLAMIGMEAIAQSIPHSKYPFWTYTALLAVFGYFLYVALVCWMEKKR